MDPIFCKKKSFMFVQDPCYYSPLVLMWLIHVLYYVYVQATLFISKSRRPGKILRVISSLR